MVDKRSKVFLGGPPLVKLATGEESDDESLGGAEMHARTSGLADYFAADEQDAIRIGRQIVGRLDWCKEGRAPHIAPAPPRYDEEDLLGLAPEDLRTPFDPREVVARIVDGSDFDEFKPLYGPSLMTGWARIHGFPVGILANVRGVLFSPEAQKAGQFIQLANRSHTPLVFLQNTTGYMVGKDYEEGGIIKHGAQMIKRGGQLEGPAPDRHHGRLLRGGELRHVRALVRAAVPVHLAEREVRGDGSDPSWPG